MLRGTGGSSLAGFAICGDVLDDVETLEPPRGKDATSAWDQARIFSDRHDVRSSRGS